MVQKRSKTDKKVEKKVNKKVEKKPVLKKEDHKTTKKTVVKETKNRKRKIDVRMIVVLAVLLVAVVVVAIVLAFYGRHEEINDSYFTTDANKVVFSYNKKEVMPLENKTGYEVDRVYIVYYVSGNNVTGKKAFYEYDDAEEAKAVYENVSLTCDDSIVRENNDETDEEVDNEYSDSVCNSWATTKSLNGKYVIMQYNRDSFEEFTAEQVREAAELDDSEDDSEDDAEDDVDSEDDTDEDSEDDSEDNE